MQTGQVEHVGPRGGCTKARSGEAAPTGPAGRGPRRRHSESGNLTLESQARGAL